MIPDSIRDECQYRGENEYQKIHLLKYLNKTAILDLLANKKCHYKYPSVGIYCCKTPILFQIFILKNDREDE